MRESFFPRHATHPERAARDLSATSWQHPDLRAAVATLDVPILLRVGALDTATPPERSAEIAAVARRGTIQIVPDVGHALLCEDFEATAEAIEQHLRFAEVPTP